jgi:hypothetical protein
MADDERETQIRAAKPWDRDHQDLVFLLDRLTNLRAQHDRRTSALLAANNREVERRREVEIERDHLKQLLNRAIMLPRAGDLLATVAALIPERGQWNVAEIRDEIGARGIDASVKQVDNALGYLTRRGRITRLGYGKYTAPPIEAADG